MPFFVELAADKYGNRAYTNSQPQVVEGRIEGESLIVTNPHDFPWPSVRMNSYGGWLECEGPARNLTIDERDVLIAKTLYKSASTSYIGLDGRRLLDPQ